MHYFQYQTFQFKWTSGCFFFGQNCPPLYCLIYIVYELKNEITLNVKRGWGGRIYISGKFSSQVHLKNNCTNV